MSRFNVNVTGVRCVSSLYAKYLIVSIPNVMIIDGLVVKQKTVSIVVIVIVKPFMVFLRKMRRSKYGRGKET